ncbi:MAG: endo-1,4-beta-xylanase [Armatimonadetes bacterium]|nr:endo-1,4-beta-xylanase [Armatimonadota bacterium]
MRFLLSVFLISALSALTSSAHPANLINPKAWDLRQPAGEYATLETVPAEGKPDGHKDALRITVKKAAEPFYALSVGQKFPAAVSRHDRVSLRFWARSATGNPLRAVIEKAGPPYTSVAGTSPSLAREWKEYRAVGNPAEEYGPNDLHVRFQMGHQPGVVELAGVTVENLGPDPALKAAERAVQPAAVRERIRKHRMGELKVLVRDKKGRPVRNATVTVEQTRHAFLFGCNLFNFQPENTEPWQAAYRERFAALFNFATLPFYWGSVVRERGKTRHERIEAMARWCRAHGITPKGHPLVWHEVYPAWAPKEAEATLPVLREWVQDNLRRYRELIPIWDVMNEANVAATYPQTGVGDWVRQVGPARAVATALEWAEAATKEWEPLLLYNDFNTGEENVRLLKQLQEWNALPDAVGIQSHMHNGGHWDLVRVWLTANRFAQFGKPVHFTEVSVLSGPRRENYSLRWPYVTDWLTTPEEEAAQAAYLERFYSVLFSHPDVHAITYWDFSDREAWLGAPTGLLRRDMTPKPAYDRLMKLIRKEWWTKATGKTGSTGRYGTRVFYGEHRVTATDGTGKRVTQTVSLPMGSGARTVTLTLP